MPVKNKKMFYLKESAGGKDRSDNCINMKLKNGSIKNEHNTRHLEFVICLVFSKKAMLVLSNFENLSLTH